jgi:hypothetical protein
VNQELALARWRLFSRWTKMEGYPEQRHQLEQKRILSDLEFIVMEAFDVSPRCSEV